MSKMLVKVVCFILCISLLSGLAIAQPITNNTHVDISHADFANNSLLESTITGTVQRVMFGCR